MCHIPLPLLFLSIFHCHILLRKILFHLALISFDNGAASIFNKELVQLKNYNGKAARPCMDKC
jgi:hypothetical protein